MDLLPQKGTEMKTFRMIEDVVRDVRFDHHPSIRIRTRKDTEGIYVQLMDEDLDEEFNTGRKWRVSVHMTDSEIVGTLWKAYMTWLEHEARESFLYRGRAVYGPHLDVKALWELAGDRNNYEYRS